MVFTAGANSFARGENTPEKAFYAPYKPGKSLAAVTFTMAYSFTWDITKTK